MFPLGNNLNNPSISCYVVLPGLLFVLFCFFVLFFKPNPLLYPIYLFLFFLLYFQGGTNSHIIYISFVSNKHVTGYFLYFLARGILACTPVLTKKFLFHSEPTGRVLPIPPVIFLIRLVMRWKHTRTQIVCV